MIKGDAVNPRPKIAFALKSFQTRDDFDKNFLRRVQSVIGVEKKFQRNVVNVILMTLYEQFERVFITC
jgi:hypothetical protein